MAASGSPRLKLPIDLSDIVSAERKLQSLERATAQAEKNLAKLYSNDREGVSVDKFQAQVRKVQDLHQQRDTLSSLVQNRRDAEDRAARFRADMRPIQASSIIGHGGDVRQFFNDIKRILHTQDHFKTGETSDSLRGLSDIARFASNYLPPGLSFLGNLAAHGLGAIADSAELNDPRTAAERDLDIRRRLHRFISPNERLSVKLKSNRHASGKPGYFKETQDLLAEAGLDSSEDAAQRARNQAFNDTQFNESGPSLALLAKMAKNPQSVTGKVYSKVLNTVTFGLYDAVLGSRVKAGEEEATKRVEENIARVKKLNEAFENRDVREYNELLGEVKRTVPGQVWNGYQAEFDLKMASGDANKFYALSQMKHAGLRTGK